MSKVNIDNANYVRDIASRILTEDEVKHGSKWDYVKLLDTEKAVKKLLIMLQDAGYDLYVKDDRRKK